MSKRRYFFAQVDENGERWEESFDGAMRALPTPGYTLYYFSEWG